MDCEKIELSSVAVELSETQNYVELTNRLCFYGEPNLNNVVLPVENAAEKAQTLIHQPVVAKYRVYDGKPDLGGHEYHVDRNGEAVFGTENIGTHIAVEVRDDTVPVNGEVKTLPCLFATSRIWTRNKNMIAAVKRLYNEGRLHSSWELTVSDYEYRDGLKFLQDYAFSSNALLGTRSQPAYGDAASALALAENESDPEIIIAEALGADLFAKEDNTMEDIKTPVEAEVQAPEAIGVEQSEAEKYAEISEKLIQLTSQIEEKNTALIAANAKVNELSAQIEELTKYKEMFDKAEADRLAAEKEEQREQMKAYALNSKLITSEELETSEELKKMIEDVDMNGIKSVIADRFMKTLEGEKTEEAEVAEVEEPTIDKAEVLESEKIDNRAFMEAMLRD